MANTETFLQRGDGGDSLSMSSIFLKGVRDDAFMLANL